VDEIIVGTWNGVPAPTSPTACAPPTPGFTVVVRDFANVPLPNTVVALVFAGAGLRLYQAQPPGTTIDCPGKTVSRVTDASGTARFVVRFGGSVTVPAVQVFANGVFLKTVPALSCDYNADGVVGLGDFGLFSFDFLSPTPQARSDFNNCPSSGLADYAFFSAQYIACLGQPPTLMCP
jgi:hypothetical protein